MSSGAADKALVTTVGTDCCHSHRCDFVRRALDRFFVVVVSRAAHPPQKRFGVLDTDIFRQGLSDGVSSGSDSGWHGGNTFSISNRKRRRGAVTCLTRSTLRAERPAQAVPPFILTQRLYGVARRNRWCATTSRGDLRKLNMPFPPLPLRVECHGYTWAMATRTTSYALTSTHPFRYIRLLLTMPRPQRHLIEPVQHAAPTFRFQSRWQA